MRVYAQRSLHDANENELKVESIAHVIIKSNTCVKLSMLCVYAVRIFALIHLKRCAAILQSLFAFIVKRISVARFVPNYAKVNV